ncbi:uncharacterized protein LAESUDRAFT_731432 [Laetiporus sulphureus 93-53]|uniref:Uncharacterized protein n=1 Tax=Laetiporus sulphureus 93-53 TaxID=1314785 RepID=A0A165BKF8_9APHY|nr:uncharacterized protein LAESUDRAFT_731432 [Laetiporus sulphureus 93-53]KZT01218.1 hypothetical protein LAESUDRAFT_731432 [Laetiporus sulphureus 93-53]
MGITGLLPLMRDIQVQRPLSYFAGQTLAVDAYVWLHKGICGCAPELATKKPTTKYVDYAMHRVRMLQHHRIQPYVVFDGGPLPAKQRTESDRKKRRDENLARANALAAQGKHRDAREYYTKCVDVTPQMAYQLIKALRAESVPYVVAPYEADAQLAYLERIGLVDGIITEDSDLLVFGCRKVLLKMDVDASRITCISRDDFASLASGSSGGISLFGWSDVQFRHMAILGGCDYLPNIHGIGLKTAWSLLRKYKTVENVIRVLSLEGKKKIPQGYLEAFRMAEKVFLYQRVYDPTQERLVHLMDLPEGEQWDEEMEAYVGANLDASLAKRVAEGDACPISLLPMEDINPTFAPRALRPLPMNQSTQHRAGKDRGKARRKVPGKPDAGILSFFPPKVKVDAPSRALSQTATREGQPSVKLNTTAGRSSGKRTLAEVMDRDMAAKRKKQDETCPEIPIAGPSSSRFFCAVSSSPPGGMDRQCHDREAAADPSHLEEDKENVPYPEDDEGLMTVLDPVTQEDGYISPSPSMVRWDTPELSSPLQAREPPEQYDSTDDDDNFGTDVLSSPSTIKPIPRLIEHMAFGKRNLAIGNDEVGTVLVRDTPSPGRHDELAVEEDQEFGPDLRRTLGECDWEEVTSDSECADASPQPVCSTSSSPGPVTPDDSAERAHNGAIILDEDPADADELDELLDPQDIASRNAKVANGWWEKWGRTTRPNGWKQTPLRRRETTVTLDGRQRPLQPRPRSGQRDSKRDACEQDLRAAGRRSLIFTEEMQTGPPSHRSSCARAGSGGSKKEEDVGTTTKNRLAEFR